MKGYVLFLLLLTVLLGLADAMVSGSSYVLISYNTTTLESTLWGFLLIVVLAAAGLWLLWFGIRIVLVLTGVIYPVTSKSRERLARRMTIKGLSELTQGLWKPAQRHLSRAAEYSNTPLLNYLAAAKAAHEAGDTKASAEYLRRADMKEPKAELAIGITHAQLQLSSGQLEQALAVLKKLHQQHPDHSYVLKMLKEVYSRLGDWESILPLLLQLKKRKILADEELRKLEEQCSSELFSQAFSQGRTLATTEQKTEPAMAVWNSLSSKQRKQPEMIARYVDCLIKLGAEKKSESMLCEQLKKQYDSKLIQLYGKVNGGDTTKQFRFAEAMLGKRPNDPDLLLTLGRLAMQNEQWTKAQEYLQKSLRYKQRTETYNELGQLLVRLKDYQGSAHSFQAGLELAAKSSLVNLERQGGEAA